MTMIAVLRTMTGYAIGVLMTHLFYYLERKQNIVKGDK